MYQTDNEIELKHIAIKSNNRRKGLGKKLIMEFMEENLIRRMEAETDKNAVNFYRKIGFNITSLGEKYPGVERFKCTLNKE
nr:GNAT family N-acetyltransferase [Paenibacillus solani]